MTQTVPERSAIDVQHAWDAASIFSSSEAWQAAFDQATAQSSELAKFQGHLGESATVLADWFDAALPLQNLADKIYVYASMNHDVDTTNQAAVAQLDQANGLYARVLAAMAFAEPELLALGYDTLRQWMSEEARLQPYAHYFDGLFQRQAHVRSAEVEELLSQAMDPFGTATRLHGTFVDADLQFPPATNSAGEAVPLAQGNIGTLLTDPDREVRRTAWERYADAHLALKNGLAGCLALGVKQNVFVARARRYPSALEASLAANYIPPAVFHNLIDTFRRNLPTWHRYWNIRRRALGYNELYPYDVKAPLVSNPPKVSYQQSVDWIAEGMLPLGEEYVSIMRDGVTEQRWVDIYPNQGKRSGAYSSGVQGTHPFILMSYTDDMYSMSTLAHEIGHSMHSYYTWRAQPLAYSYYSIFVAEVASNFNQALVRAHLFETNSDRDFQISLIEEAMSNFHRYFFIMPTLARFELEMHQRVERGQALTADGLNALLADLFSEGYGDEVVVDRERVGITWAQFPIHLYLNFYVYQYATGLSAAHALADKVRAGEPGVVDRYLAFLSAGSSQYPLDALQRAGVDMTSPEPVEQTFGVLAAMVDRLEQLLG